MTPPAYGPLVILMQLTIVRHSLAGNENHGREVLSIGGDEGGGVR